MRKHVLRKLTSGALYGGDDDEDTNKALEDQTRALVPDNGCNIG